MLTGLSALKRLGAFLANLGIGTIVNKLAAAYQAKQVAKTDQERIAADVRIKTLEARRDVLVAEGHTPINAFIRAGFAAGPFVYLTKIFIWDKALGWGTTDDLTPDQWKVIWIVLGFYFLYEASRVVSRNWK